MRINAISEEAWKGLWLVEITIKPYYLVLGAVCSLF